MSGAMLTQLLQSFIALSVFLLIGTFLRAVVPFFQKVFLPASVIGGFLALLAGPIVWQGGGIPFPSEWITTWSALPGVLIVPVVASVPLGLKMGLKKTGNKKSSGKSSKNIILMFCIVLISAYAMALAGIGLNWIFSGMYDLYPVFGYELSLGFSGGHGTAGVIGSMLEAMGQPFWEISQGITVATATAGLIGGTLLGVVYINIQARRGQTALLKKPSEIPADMLKGIQRDPALQKSTGSETTMNSSIESITFHLAVVLLACGVAYLVMGFVRANQIPLITQIPVWTYALLAMFGINYLINKLGLTSLIDSKTKSRVSGTLTDYAIIAAIASMPIQMVMQYALPLVVMIILGFVISYFAVIFLCKRLFKDDYHVERAAALWGVSTGVFITGMMLLKISDPEFESPVLNDLSIGFAVSGVVAFIILPIAVGMMIDLGLVISALFKAALLLALFIVMFITKRARDRIKEGESS